MRFTIMLHYVTTTNNDNRGYMKHLNTTNIIASISLIYLYIEAQSWLFLSRIYNSTLTNEILSQYEKFGYASAGIGISLLFVRRILNAEKTTKARILYLLLTPLIYISSVWLIYEGVNKIPSLIPVEAKPIIMQKSLRTLAKPSWNNLALPWGNQHADIENISDDINAFMKTYPTADRVIQAAFISGIRNISMFSEYYSASAKYVNKGLWLRMWNELETKQYFEAEMQEPKITRHFVFSKNHINATNSLPSLLSSLFTIYLAKKSSTTLHDYITSTHSSLPSGTVHQYQKEQIRKMTWEVFDEVMPLGPYALEDLDNDILERLRVAYSAKSLSKYAHLPTNYIEWDVGGNPLHQKTYLMAASQVAPFLFNAESSPLLSLNQLYTEKSRMRYIDTLQRGLPNTIKKLWDEYELRTLLNLSLHSDSWLKPVDNGLHEHILRVGTVTPLMLFASTIFIIMNVIVIFLANKKLGIIGLIIIASTLSGVLSHSESYLTELMLHISVKESQVYLY
jgi:hypothetical protein